MKTIKINVSRDDHVKIYLRLWNGVIGLTNGELLTLEEIVKKYLSLVDQGVKVPYCWELTFSTASRKEYQSTLGYSQQQFNNFFKQLRDKGVLLDEKDYYTIDKRMIPLPQITFEFNVQ